jgi:streptogramin lyase
MKKLLPFSLIFCAFIVFSCQEDKFDINSLPKATTNANISDTIYIKQNPDWTGFNSPQAVIVGNEGLVYVADTYNDRIVMLDIAGRLIGYSQRIQRPVAIAQDKRLQLLVCAEFDTVLRGQETTFGAVYRLNLPAASYDISRATPMRVIWDTTLGNYASRRYTAIATTYYSVGSSLNADAYYVGRTGQNNTATYDPDDAIVLYSKNDVFQSSVTQEFAQEGTGLLSMHNVTALATKPTGTSTEFVFAQIENSAVTPLWKVQWIQLTVQGQTENWASKFYPSTDGDIDFLRINRFVQPRGLALDQSGNLFVADAGTDSIYHFNSRGIEQYSFGGHNDPYGRNFNQPYGIAYYDADKTLFVADKGNNRICRFKLSIDMY